MSLFLLTCPFSWHPASWRHGNFNIPWGLSPWSQNTYLKESQTHQLHAFTSLALCELLSVEGRFSFWGKC